MLTLRGRFAGTAALIGLMWLGSAIGTAWTGVPDTPTTPTVSSGEVETVVDSPPSPRASRAARSRPASLPGRERATTLDVTHDWSGVIACESGGDPRALSPTGKFRGLVQFSLSSWRAVGMSGDPIDYPAAVQIEAAERLLKMHGPGAWPECSRWLR